MKYHPFFMTSRKCAGSGGGRQPPLIFIRDFKWIGNSTEVNSLGTEMVSSSICVSSYHVFVEQFQVWLDFLFVLILKVSLSSEWSQATF